jgi:hypothetical protein
MERPNTYPESIQLELVKAVDQRLQSVFEVVDRVYLDPNDEERLIVTEVETFPPKKPVQSAGREAIAIKR